MPKRSQSGTARLIQPEASTRVLSQAMEQAKPDGGDVPDALKNFSSLPNDAYVRLPVVLALFSISNTTAWRWVNSKRLPQPRRFSERHIAWNVGELRAVLNGGKPA